MSYLLTFNPTVMVHEFDGASESPMSLCEVPGEVPDSPARYLLPVEIVGFLKQFDGARTTDEVVRSYAGTQSKHTPEKLTTLVTQYCVQKRLLIDPAAAGQTGPAEARRTGYLYMKVGLLSPRLVSALCTPLTWLFRWEILLALLPVFIITQAYFFLAIMPRFNFNFNQLTGFDFFYLTLITSGFGLFHELGHAAALNSYGFRRSEIGWGLYISFAVYYTDLSDAWKLKRMQRAMVDLGGIYFHCISLLFLLGAILWFRSPLLVYAFFFIQLQIAGALNPFLRMDGYWLVGDLFGIADLRARTVRIVEHIIYRLLGIQTVGADPFRDLNRKSRVFLLLYVCSGVAFLGYLYQIVFVQVMFELLPAYPKLLMTGWATLHAHPLHPLQMLDIGSGILWKGLAIYGLVFFVYKMIVALYLWILRTVKAGRSRSEVSVIPRAGSGI